MPKSSLLLIDLMECTLPTRARFHDGHEYVLEDSTAEAMKKLRKPRLVFKTKATHSGVLINQRVYPGLQMRPSAKYWLKDYGKPILEQHPAMPTMFNPSPKEPKTLGRVMAARYVQLVTDSMLEHDFEQPQPMGSDGSGYIELGCGISDQSAVEEIIDRRKVTLSVGMRPTKMICSICKQDWMDKGPCAHEPGRVYEIENSEKTGKFLAYGITGKLKYHHLAFTWRPADTKAQVEAAEMADSYSDWSYLTGSPEREAGELTGFRIVDSDSGAFLEMDLANLNAMATTPTNSNDQVRTEPAITVRDVVLAPDQDHEEDSMANEHTESNKVPAPASEETPVESATDTYYWSQPDPVDGHTHGVEKLDDSGNGETTESGSPAHKHEIKDGRVLPYTPESGQVSRHPGTYYYDSETETMRCELVDGDPADGNKLPAENAPAPEATEVSDTTEAKDADSADEKPSETPEEDGDASEEAGVERMSEVELEDHEQLLDFYTANPEDKELQDAKLTAAARKKLPSSAFCGPDRSFPAHDAAHVRAALQRLSQGYPKGASDATRAEIRACVVKKAKQFGVKVSGDSEDATDANTQATILRTLAAQVEKLDSENKKLHVEVREIREQCEQYKTQADELSEKNRTLLVDSIVQLELATGKKNIKHYKDEQTLQAYKDELLKREFSSLEDAAKDLHKELFENDAVGTQTSQTEQTDIPVKSLGDSPTADEDPQSVDRASRFKQEQLSLLQGK